MSGRNLLLALSAISVVGAALIAWLFVDRVLLRRLERLSDRMRRMAGGDLEAKVEITGRDEVADMVEELAEELRGKNEQLEDVLANLHQAQDQNRHA